MKENAAMKCLFCDEKHEQCFYAMLAQDKTCSGDRERESMFFILSGNQELYEHRSLIYNYQTHRLRQNSLNKLDYMCSSSKKLLRLSLHLYNSCNLSELTPYSLLNNLDSENLNLALNGMLLRFS